MGILGLDYYTALFLQRGCTETEIKKAYKKMALLHHPTRTKVERPVTPSLRYQDQLIRDQQRQMDSYQVFVIVCEAYDVLGDPKRRAIYDLYGERALKEGLQGPDGFIPPYSYHGDPHKTFHDFFGTDNPFIDLLAAACVPIDHWVSGNVDPSKLKVAQVTRDLWLEMEEFYLGCVKKVQIRRKIYMGKGKEPGALDKILTIEVKPGTPIGTKYCFPNEGDEGGDTQAPDIVFVIRQREHPTYQRDGNNIILEQEVNLCNALTGHLLEITTLDKRIFNVAVVHIIHPGYEKVITGEGFPIYGEPERKGDMIIRFQVTYPHTLSQEQKKLAKTSLDCGPAVDATSPSTCYNKIPPATMTRLPGCVCPFVDRHLEEEVDSFLPSAGTQPGLHYVPGLEPSHLPPKPMSHLATHHDISRGITHPTAYPADTSPVNANPVPGHFSQTVVPLLPHSHGIHTHVSLTHLHLASLQ